MTLSDAQKALQVSILLRFIALQCQDVRRCAHHRCRRSGRCVRIAQTVRAMGAEPPRVAAKPPRRRRQDEGSLPGRVRSA